MSSSSSFLTKISFQEEKISTKNLSENISTVTFFQNARTHAQEQELAKNTHLLCRGEVSMYNWPPPVLRVLIQLRCFWWIDSRFTCLVKSKPTKQEAGDSSPMAIILWMNPRYSVPGLWNKWRTLGTSPAGFNFLNKLLCQNLADWPYEFYSMGHRIEFFGN